MVTPPFSPPRERGGKEFVYASPLSREGQFIALDEAEAHHLFKVRRVGVGETVFVTTGSGMVYECMVRPIPNPKSQIPHPSPTLHIKGEHPEFGEPMVHITLCMSMLKGDSNREVVDVATQLGTREICFFQAERSEGKLHADKLEKLRRVAVTAIKQCGRARLPEIKLYPKLSQLLSSFPADVQIFLAHPAEASITPSARSLQKPRVALLIGPEGGFTAQELELAAGRATVLHLGNCRLRAETAVAAGLSYLLTCAGEMSSS